MPELTPLHSVEEDAGHLVQLSLRVDQHLEVVERLGGHGVDLVGVPQVDAHCVDVCAQILQTTHHAVINISTDDKKNHRQFSDLS